MKRILYSVALIAAGLFASPAHAGPPVTCSDTGLSYLTTCGAGTNGQACIVPTGTLNGCCNKGTCNNSGTCVTGGAQDATCLNDGNACTSDSCTADIVTLQATCNHAALAAGTACEADSNVCTIDQCNGSSSSPACVNVSTNTCASEQSSNPAGQCEQWQCDNPQGCHRAPLAAGTVCDDGRDCTTGDSCDANGNCSRGATGSLAPAGTPCRDDDTHLPPDSRTWCKAGTCNGTAEGCRSVHLVDAGAACDPNPCTNSTCTTRGGDCVVNSCNTGSSVYCAPCGQTLDCQDMGAPGSANNKYACGCASTY